MSTNPPDTSVSATPTAGSIATTVPPSASAPVRRRPSGLDVPAPSLARLVRVELRKAVDTVTGRWLLIVIGILVLGALGLAAAFPPEGEQADLPFLLSFSLLPTSTLLPVLGVLLMSGEFSTRSVLTTFALVPSRGRVVVAKTAAAILLAVAGAVLSLLLTVAAAGVLDLAGRLGGWSVEPGVLLQMLVVQVVFLVVGVGFGLLCQNTPLAVITYLVVPTVLAPVILLVPALREIGPWIDLTAGTTALTTAELADGTDWARAASVTAIWAGVPFVLGWLRLRRREIA